MIICKPRTRIAKVARIIASPDGRRNRRIAGPLPQSKMLVSWCSMTYGAIVTGAGTTSKFRCRVGKGMNRQR